METHIISYADINIGRFDLDVAASHVNVAQSWETMALDLLRDQTAGVSEYAKAVDAHDAAWLLERAIRQLESARDRLLGC